MISYKRIIKEIKRIVWQRQKDDVTGHDFWHSQRVVKNALQIGRKEKADLKILELASWLHDIEVVKSKKDHEIKSALFAKKFLIDFNLPDSLIDKVARCIRRHRFSKGLKAETLEQKILQDADKLDALGAIGLARLFVSAGKWGQITHNPRIKPDFDYYLRVGISNSTINHFYDKLFKLKNLMHTKTAKKIASDREQYMKDYLKRFYLEWDGKK